MCVSLASFVNLRELFADYVQHSTDKTPLSCDKRLQLQALFISKKDGIRAYGLCKHTGVRSDSYAMESFRSTMERTRQCKNLFSR